MAEKEALDNALKTLKETAVDDRISCAEALGIADACGVSPREVGKMADDLGIRITNCQLGCFGSGKPK